MNPIISVIIPAYNTEAYIERAIRSILNQTLKNLEIIIVDDASTDSTFQVAEAIEDPRIKLIHCEQNIGAGGARNLALKEAKGEWIAVLDSDDWYAPNRLERLLEAAIYHGADMIADDLYLVNEGEVDPWSTLVKWSEKSLDPFIKISSVFFALDNVEGQAGMFLGYSKPMFRRRFLNENNIQYLSHIKIAEDFWLDMECLIRGANFILITQPYYYYQTRQASLTSNVKRVLRLSQECETIQLFLKRQVQALHSQPELKQALEYKYRETKKHLDYYQVIEALKDRKPLMSAFAITRSPGFFTCLISRIPGIFKRRFQSRILKKDDAFGKFTH
jgi:succinoglycan biosynthesis protein ExoO